MTRFYHALAVVYAFGAVHGSELSADPLGREESTEVISEGRVLNAVGMGLKHTLLVELNGNLFICEVEGSELYSRSKAKIERRCFKESE